MITYKLGEEIQTTKDIEVEGKKYPKGTKGKIFDTPNNISWAVVLYNSKDNSDSTGELGRVVLLKSTDFTVEYHIVEHRNVLIKIKDALKIPFVTLDNLRKTQELELTLSTEEIYSEFYPKEKYITLAVLYDVIDKEFTDFCYKLESEKNNHENIELDSSIEYVLTEDAVEQYIVQREEIEKEFTKVTSLTTEFTGNIITVNVD